MTLAPNIHLFFFRQKSLFAHSFTLWEQQTVFTPHSLENYSSPASFHLDPRLSLLGSLSLSLTLSLSLSLSLLTRWNKTRSPEEAAPVIRLKWAEKMEAIIWYWTDWII